MHTTLAVKKLAEGAKLPVVAHPGEDLAYDVFALEDTILPYGKVVPVRTGIALQANKLDIGSIRTWAPLGLIVKDRSSMAKQGIVSRGGVIDSGYTGEIVIFMSSTDPDTRYERMIPANSGAYPIRVLGYEIKAGDKIAQLVPVEVLTGHIHEVAEFAETSRGDKGFGSSGS